MKPKLLVTGANGFVAGSVLTQAGLEWEVYALSRGPAPAGTGQLTWLTCDSLKRSELENTFRTIRPNVLIHTAAIADIDVSERNHELARAVNVDMTRTLMNLCAETGCRMVHCSTDTVFDGEHAPYREQDAPAPVNYYGQTKLEAERIVSSVGSNAVIARLAIVMGLPVLGSGNSFLARMIRTMREGGTIIVPGQEVRTPLDVITAGRALLELADNHTGIFHLAGNERLDRMQMGRRIAARLNLDSSLLKPQDPSELAGRAPRPRDVSLDNSRAGHELKTPMRDFDDALSLVLPRS
jgi:dTDP-4-dehydrorhamnose reductase